MFCELSQQGLISFSGEEAQNFLHNQLSCDVAGLAPDRSTYGAYCTPKGRMLASFLLWRAAQGYFMQLPSSLREPVQKQLSKFILRSKVKAEDASGSWVKFGVAGEGASPFMEKTFGWIPQTSHEVLHLPDLMLLRLPSDRFEIVASQHKAPEILEALTDTRRLAGPGHWAWLDIRAGIPIITPATQEAFVPQMVNLDLIGGVSFEKGCYPGQEIVARMHYRGTLKQRMVLTHIAGTDSPQPGDKLYSADFGEQACGTIVNAAHSPEGGYDALAVIQIASAGKGNVRWRSSGGPALKQLPLPYAVPAAD
jgi:hypothetical protein